MRSIVLLETLVQVHVLSKPSGCQELRAMYFTVIILTECLLYASDCFRNGHMTQFWSMRCQGKSLGSLGRGFLDAKEDKGEEGPYVSSLLIPLQRVSLEPL